MSFSDRLVAWLELKQWKTHWKVPDTVELTVPRGDYRDRLPTRPEDIAEQYASVVKEGQWTLGLVECWGKRSKVIKSSVHVPCCPSFRFLPWKWRGVCFGRTIPECFYFGCMKGRWARQVHALNLGREYLDPFEGLARTNHEIADEVACLCFFDQCLAIVLGLGIGQCLSVCGNCGVNFAACYSCHSREKFRRKYNLPPTFGLPPGVDDCCVHFLCNYCSSHQELREAVMRGLDGPGTPATTHVQLFRSLQPMFPTSMAHDQERAGISPLDVWPSSWKHVEGFEEEVEYRKAKLEMLREAGHLFLPFEQRINRDPGLAVRAGRQLREYHYKRLGLEAPEHGKGHFHHPRQNYQAGRAARAGHCAQSEDLLPQELNIPPREPAQKPDEPRY